MGFSSTIQIRNDCLDSVLAHPREWVDAIVNNRFVPGKDFGACGFVNGMRTVAHAHNDVTTVAAVGSNYSSVLWTGHRGNLPHHLPDDQLKLLEVLANAHGLTLVPRR